MKQLRPLFQYRITDRQQKKIHHHKKKLDHVRQILQNKYKKKERMERKED